MNPERSAWGDDSTKFFHALTPERILDAVEESLGVRCTGRAFALNSMENRVYELEIELDEPPKTPADRFVIVKFYRPGRWSEAQIREEHKFLMDLQELEIPAVAPLTLRDGDTLHSHPGAGLWYAVFPKIGGRSPDELNEDDIARVGRLLARIHNVGAAGKAPHRIKLTPESYGIRSLKDLLDRGIIPEAITKNYQRVVEEICEKASPWFAEANYLRVHGDCHLGNLLTGRHGFFFVDFDDMVQGPAVQDLWLLIPDRDDEAKRRLRIMVESYEMMRSFDRRELRLIEALRALRFVHFSAWIARRWEDPAFPRAFPFFGSERYWAEQLADLREQRMLLEEAEQLSF